jgi:hypothetical protein
MRILIATLFYFGLAHPIIAQQDTTLFSIRAGETLPLKPITWSSSSSCLDMLSKVDSVDVLEAVSGVSLKFEPRSIHVPFWKGCPEGGDLSGGYVMITAGSVTHKTEGDITYRVLFQSLSGPSQMTYRNHVVIFPAAATR